MTWPAPAPRSRHSCFPVGSCRSQWGTATSLPATSWSTTRADVVVLDPLARWAVPAQEDLCRFLVGVQLNGLQLHTRGAAYAEDTLGCWQRQVVEGYYGADVPWGPLRCYQLLVLLDKWSALLEPAPHGGVAAAARTLSQQRTTGYVRRRAQGLLDLARSANG